MPNYVPMTRPHTGHTPLQYWDGVADIALHSNFERPKVSVRTGPLATTSQIPPAYQPPIASASIGLAEPDPQPWRGDQQ